MNRILRMRNAAWFSLLALIALTSGCGGSGSSSGGKITPATTYTGKTSQAVINQSNSKVLTAAGSDSGKISFGVALSSVVGKPVARTAKITAQAVSTPPETVNGNCGGNSVTTSTSDSATGNISGSTTYNSYCQDGTTENGKTTFSGALSQANSLFDITITFSSYSTKDTTGDTMINGTAALKGTLLADGSINNTTMIMNADSKDNTTNIVTKMENVNVTISDTTGYTEFTINSGRVYYPDYGYFELSTPTAIRTNSGDAYPSSGVLVIVGANNSKAKLTYLSKTQYKVEADETGGGTYTLDGTYDSTTDQLSTGGGTTTVTLTSITITPANASMALGSPAIPYMASGNYSNGIGTTNLQSNWTSSNTAIVKVDNFGFVTAVAVGTATITATASGVSGNTPVTVTGTAPGPGPGPGESCISYTVGNTYKMQGAGVTTDSTVTSVNGTSVTITTVITTGADSVTTVNDLIVSCNSTSVVKNVTTFADLGIVTNSYSPPLKGSPLSLTSGNMETASSTLTTTSSLTGVVCTGPVTSSFEVLGAEPVTVPAGTFNNAVKFTSSTAVNLSCIGGTGYGYGGANETDTNWIVPGLGAVKSLSSAGVPAELVSYTR